MTDSREKGKRGEYQVRDKLRQVTGLSEWERVPGSGAFGQNHGLKGDVYLPATCEYRSKYCIEVKWYAGDNISSNLLNATESILEKWWSQTVREAEQMHMRPLLVFKKDRGDWLIALSTDDPLVDILFVSPHIILGKGGFEIVIGNFDKWVGFNRSLMLEKK
ncbi:RusA-like Holliday junction resolvase [Pectobacterium phage My1]|uniref:Putative D14 protein n=1 Tax=Pectobacterium phage My1 TaxID=1204539 RepID=J9QNY6_9CAUD|nr:RusA-like Holliday junction resolvase [Pectobacterium phage My1]AFQ22282.1 putative D14 protein [Pectobacterium phage My1]